MSLQLPFGGQGLGPGFVLTVGVAVLKLAGAPSTVGLVCAVGWMMSLPPTPWALSTDGLPFTLHPTATGPLVHVTSGHTCRP